MGRNDEKQGGEINRYIIAGYGAFPGSRMRE